MRNLVKNITSIGACPHMLSFNIRKPKAVVYAGEGKLDFTWKLKHGLKVMVR